MDCQRRVSYFLRNHSKFIHSKVLKSMPTNLIPAVAYLIQLSRNYVYQYSRVQYFLAWCLQCVYIWIHAESAFGYIFSYRMSDFVYSLFQKVRLPALESLNCAVGVLTRQAGLLGCGIRVRNAGRLFYSTARKNYDGRRKETLVSTYCTARLAARPVASESMQFETDRPAGFEFASHAAGLATSLSAPSLTSLLLVITVVPRQCLSVSRYSDDSVSESATGVLRETVCCDGLLSTAVI